MNYALIKDGLVENVISAEPEYIETLRLISGHEDYVLLDEKDGQPFIGGAYDGKTFSEPPPKTKEQRIQELETKIEKLDAEKLEIQGEIAKLASPDAEPIKEPIPTPPKK